MKYFFPESLTSIRRNSVWLLAARVCTQGLSVVFIALVARRLDTAGFGQFTFIAAILAIGNTFTSFGTDTWLVRELAKTRSLSFVSGAFVLQLALALLWYFATLFLRRDVPLLIYSLTLFPLSLFSVVSSLMRGFERMDLFWGLCLINGIVQVVCAILSSNLILLCIFLLAGSLITAVLGLWMCHIFLPNFSFLPVGDFRVIFHVLLPFAALATLSLVSQKLGILLISLFSGNVATGVFSAAIRIFEGIKIGHYAVLGSLLPILSRDLSYSKREYRTAFFGLLGLSFLLAGLSSFFAKDIVPFLFGARYAPASSLLMVLAWSLTPYTISSFISVNLVVRGKEGLLLKAITVSLLLWIPLFVILIKGYGLIGAAWAVLFGEIIQAVILSYIFSKGLKKFRGLNFEITNEIL